MSCTDRSREKGGGWKKYMLEMCLGISCAGNWMNFNRKLLFYSFPIETSMVAAALKLCPLASLCSHHMKPMQLKPFPILSCVHVCVQRAQNFSAGSPSDISKYNYTTAAERDVCLCAWESEHACVILSYLVVLCAYDMNRVMWFLCTYSLLLSFTPSHFQLALSLYPCLYSSLMNNKMSKHNLNTLNRWHSAPFHYPPLKARLCGFRFLWPSCGPSPRIFFPLLSCTKLAFMMLSSITKQFSLIFIY